MLLRIFTTLIILVGIVVGILALALPRDQLVNLIVFRDFFDICLPVLAFGALVKYLCTSRSPSHHHHEGHCHAPECQNKIKDY